MSEKLTAKQAAEQLLYKPEYAADKSACLLYTSPSPRDCS